MHRVNAKFNVFALWQPVVESDDDSDEEESFALNGDEEQLEENGGAEMDGSKADRSHRRKKRSAVSRASTSAEGYGEGDEDTRASSQDSEDEEVEWGSEEEVFESKRKVIAKSRVNVNGDKENSKAVKPAPGRGRARRIGKSRPLSPSNK